METVIRILLVVHVAAGSAALVAALASISRRKGSAQHNLAGKIYFWSMMTVAVTALPVSILRPNLMLFFVAMFSSYMAYGGWRLGQRDRYLPRRKPYIEWAMVLVGLAMISTGLIQVFTANSMGWVLVAFGSIGLQFAIQDIRGWGKPAEFADRIVDHLTHMLGGTIATVTAVLVQQIVPRLGTGNPFAVAVWLAPTVIITPLIFIWARKVTVTRRVALFTKRQPQ